MRPAVTFVNYTRIYICITHTLSKLHDKLGGEIYQLLLFIYVQPANQHTIMAVALCQEVRRPYYRRHNQVLTIAWPFIHEKVEQQISR
jgi:hypothetical protein